VTPAAPHHGKRRVALVTGATGAIGFADLDVLAIGPVVPLVSAQFDRYWNSASAYAAAHFLAPPPADAAQQLQAALPRRAPTRHRWST